MDQTQQPGSKGSCAVACRRITIAFVGCCLLLNIASILKWSFTRDNTAEDGTHVTRSEGHVLKRRLAVVVPTHAGDLGSAVKAMSTWPSQCSTESLLYTDLVINFAGQESDEAWSKGVFSALAQAGGGCFARTRAVFAHLTGEVW